MTPEERQLLQDLQKRVSDLEQVRNVSFIEELKRTALSGALATSGTEVATSYNINVRNSADTGDELVSDDYDGMLVVIDNQGNQYRIGYHS